MPGFCKGPRHNSGRHAQSALCGRGKLLEPTIGKARRSSRLVNEAIQVGPQQTGGCADLT